MRGDNMSGAILEVSKFTKDSLNRMACIYARDWGRRFSARPHSVTWCLEIRNTSARLAVEWKATRDGLTDTYRETILL